MTSINIFRNSADFQHLAAGEVLFNAGDTGDVMYAVIEGRIDLSLDGKLIESVEEGGILGEMAIVDQATRSATATAGTAARVVPVNERDFTFLVHEHPTFALQVMKVMADRIRKANERL